MAWLVAHGAFNDDDLYLDDALLASDPGDDGDEQLLPGAALALKVIEGLKRAAAEVTRLPVERSGR